MVGGVYLEIEHDNLHIVQSILDELGVQCIVSLPELSSEYFVLIEDDYCCYDFMPTYWFDTNDPILNDYMKIELEDLEDLLIESKVGVCFKEVKSCKQYILK